MGCLGFFEAFRQNYTQTILGDAWALDSNLEYFLKAM